VVLNALVGHPRVSARTGALNTDKGGIVRVCGGQAVFLNAPVTRGALNR